MLGDIAKYRRFLPNYDGLFRTFRSPAKPNFW